MADDQSLIQFITSVNWEKYISDSEVHKAVVTIKDRITTLEQQKSDNQNGGGQAQSQPAASSGGSGEVDLTGATRIKLVVVGDGAVGKTSLLISFSTGKFPTEYVPTVFENYTAQMHKNNSTILLHLWDTAGQEDYDRLRPLSYPGADIVVLCFSLVSKQSLEAIANKWFPEVDHYIPDVPVILVGTKLDMREENVPDANQNKCDPVTYEMGKAMADKIKAVKYLESSAKTRKNLTQVFDEAVEVVLDARAGGGSSKPKEPGQSGAASTGDKKKKGRGGCLMM